MKRSPRSSIVEKVDIGKANKVEKMIEAPDPPLKNECPKFPTPPASPIIEIADTKSLEVDKEVETLDLVDIENDTEEENRPRHLIIFGLKTNLCKTPVQEVYKMMSSMTLDCLPELIEAKRFGASRLFQPRPIRVVFKDREDACEVLKMTSVLSQSDDYKNVYCAPDLTFSDKTSRDELIKKMHDRVVNGDFSEI